MYVCMRINTHMPEFSVYIPHTNRHTHGDCDTYMHTCVRIHVILLIIYQCLVTYMCVYVCMCVFMIITLTHGDFDTADIGTASSSHTTPEKGAGKVSNKI